MKLVCKIMGIQGIGFVGGLFAIRTSGALNWIVIVIEVLLSYGLMLYWFPETR